MTPQRDIDGSRHLQRHRIEGASGAFFYALPWLALVLGFALTGVTWNNAKQEAAGDLKTYFDFRVRQAVELTEQRLLAQVQVLRGVRGLFVGSDRVTRQAFSQYVDSLHLEEHYPGILGVGFAQIVPVSELDKHIAAVRKESGHPEYHLYPKGNRDFYTAIVYLEPFSGRNLRAFGYDMYSESVRRAAMEASRDSGKARLSGKVTLVQETNQDVQAGFLIYIPLYRNGAPQGTVQKRRGNLVGWVYSPFRMNDLAQGIYGERAADLDIEIYDGGSPSPEALMYDSVKHINSVYPSSLSSNRIIKVGNHSWTLVIRALPGLESRLNHDKPVLVAVMGLAMSMLLTLLTWVLVSGRNRAVALAKAMNQDLIQNETALNDSNAKLQTILNKSEVAITWAGADGRIEYVNPSFTALFGYTLEEVPTIEQWYRRAYPDEGYRNEVVAQWGSKIERSTEVKKPVAPMEVGITCKDGSICYALLMGSWAGDKLVAFFSDISQRKQTENRLQALLTEQKAILDNDLICLVRVKDRHIVWANPAFEKMLGYDREELGGVPTRQNYTSIEAYTALGNAAYPVLSAGGVYSSQVEHVRKDGNKIWVDLSGVMLDTESGESLWAFVDITDRKRAEQALADSEKLFKNITETSPLAIYMSTGAEQRAQYINPTFVQLFGYTLEEVPTVADWWPKAYPNEAYRTWIAEEWNRRVTRAIETRTAIEPMQVVVTCKDGSKKDIQWGFVSSGEQNWAFGLDITESEQTKASLQLAASVFSHAREGIMITDPDGTILDVNETFTRITGYSRSDVLGQNPRLLSSGRHSPEFYAAMWDDLVEVGFWSGEVWNRRKNGEVFAEMQTVSVVKDEQDKILQYVSLFSDITPLKEHEQQLEHIAHFDALTGLPNRVLLADRLHQAMTQTLRRGQPLAVAYLDLDGFKAINDEHGHDAGDQLLIAVASRMKQTLRDGDTLARLGGDEFVAVFTDLTNLETSSPIYTRLLDAAAQPVHYGEHVLQVSASVGVTFYPQTDPIDADQLLRQADQAMYLAKLAGKNRFHLFDTEQDRTARGHHESLERLQHAHKDHEFVLFYQPKVNMRTGQVVGAEALIRWQHPQRGLVLPLEFLPVIESHPFSIELGDWVISAALSQIEAWQAARLEMPISVNISALQLQQSDFKDRITTLLAAHPTAKPASLQLEVLETSALADMTHVSKIMQDCQELGVNFALDDFGTGYSSLTYLRRLPASVLKIDRSFVRDMLDDPEDLTILEGVLGLARAFRREVIAEGVETVEQGMLLLQLGCELAQGYCIARPMPANELPAWAKAWRTNPDWAHTSAVSHDKLPLLFAGVEHRAWLNHVETFLKAERAYPPTMDHHTCRFGAWLGAEKKKWNSESPVLNAIETFHKQVHAQAEALLELHAKGSHSEALKRLQELRTLSTELLAQLAALQRNWS